ncbi:MAG: bifunctional (p)ppGpp synthetase/guanosine-3',5'-bis(diphosphate) 3'-pyrophosphohydrolase [Chloroflexi bacterium]|nr:bifunctional (p)ppGpp synthetase/guanosine-3',5'-bis(diphosphate) 3'-pyrophosphohydrolase [Chloroflexota bacterium]
MVEVASDSTDLISRVCEYVEETAQVDAIRAAYDFAAKCHDGQKRLSGDPYIVHPLAAATILADLYLDPDTIKAALLHDVVEDCSVDIAELDSRFGPDVARLVDGVTKLERVDYRPPGSNGVNPADAESLYAESLRKMLVAMAEDIRVVLIKLADRLHNMRTLDPLPEAKRRRIAQETLDVYSPLAHRLGIWELKWQLDDLAFRHLNEAKYREISRMLQARRSQREAYVAEVSDRLRDELFVNQLNADVSGRPKGIYSIHRKMQKYEAEGKELSDIYDLYAMRVIVDDVAGCYAALGVTHRMWSPIPGQFDDYIATPKQNMYQALHTTVHCEGGHPLEVQIKTRDMHQVAEYGVAAHWRYKERAGSAAGGRFEERMTWLRQLLEWQRETPDTNEFLESVREDLFHDQVFVYTPKGDIVELASGATPIDFAYKIHTDLGHRISGAKLNGRLVSLDTPLENGDTVEVVAGKTGRGPSPDWLNPARGYVATNSARQKIRSWFNRQARSANITRGKDLLRRELHRMGVKLSDREVLELCRFETMEDLLAALGSGELSDAALGDRLAEHRGKEDEAAAWMPPIKGSLRLDSPTSGISVLGVGDLLTRIATCCSPIQGDAIIGFVTRSRGVSVHKVECINVLNEDEKERLVPVSWGQKQELYPVRVRIEAIDRVGLLRDVSTKLSEDKINIAWVVTRENDNATVSMELTIHIAGLQQLNRVFSRIESVRGVTSVNRVTSSPLRQTER